MRILMLSPFFPWPLHGGPGIRIYHALKELAKCGHQITLLAGYEGRVSAPPPELSSHCTELHLYRAPARGLGCRVGRFLFSRLPYTANAFTTQNVARELRAIWQDGKFDLLWAHFAFMVDLLDRRLIGEVPIVLDQHECEQVLWRQYLRNGSWGQRAVSSISLSRLREFDRRILSLVSAVLCVSEEEREFTRGLAPDHVEVWTAPNGVDTRYFTPAPTPPEGKPAILLCGNLSVSRNQGAALWFAKSMFPAIRRQIPDAEFWVVGANPPPKIRALRALPGIRVTGEVEDVRPYYRGAQVAVAPYRFGKGTKLKVLEAMAMAKPLVSTSVGCSGIEVAHGEHLFIADDEPRFVSAVLELLRDPKRGETLGRAARQCVEAKYDWGGIIHELQPKLEALTGRKSSPVEASAST